MKKGCHNRKSMKTILTARSKSRVGGPCISLIVLDLPCPADVNDFIAHLSGRIDSPQAALTSR